MWKKGYKQTAEHIEKRMSSKKEGKRQKPRNLPWPNNVDPTPISDIYFGPVEPTHRERYYRWQIKKIYINLNKFNNYFIQEDHNYLIEEDI